MCIQAHNTREIKSAIAAGETVVFIHSWARSGSTFLRYLLSDILLQRTGAETSTDLPVHPEQIIADYYCNLIAKCQRDLFKAGLLVKTHDLLDEVRRQFWGTGKEAERSFQQSWHLYSCRQPEDCLVSLYHAHLRERWVGARFPVNGETVNIDLYCRQNVGGWIQHVSSFVAAAERGAPIYFITYESLKKETAEVLGGILEWLGIPVDEEKARRAASNMEFQKLKETDPKRFGQLRHGKSGGGVAELQPETLAFLREKTAPWTTRVEALVERSASLRGELAR